MKEINKIFKNRFTDKNFKNNRYKLFKEFIKYNDDDIVYNYFYLYNLDKINYTFHHYRNKFSYGKMVHYYLFNKEGLEIENKTVNLIHDFKLMYFSLTINDESC
jgi:hypothetical protein